MKRFIYILTGLLLASCTSNTIYKKPQNLIPKDTMVVLLTDMYLASSAKNIKNKFLKREKNYVFLVYEKYKIDSTRFDLSNRYYTSKVDVYSEILNKVKSNIDSLETIYKEEQKVLDSINKGKNITKQKDTTQQKRIPLNKLPEEVLELDPDSTKNTKKDKS